MIFRGIEICCPACKRDLSVTRDSTETFFCEACGRRFPLILGIPDFRIFRDPYIDLEADRAKGRKIAERFDEFDFAGLVDYYYSQTPAVPSRHALQYTRGLKAGIPRAAAALDQWETHAGIRSGPSESLLEIGCGTAPLLVAASRRGLDRLVGIDIAFRWLVVAKKRLAQEGLELPLICACTEALPFPSGRFDRVVADSVIEHLRDPHEGLTEVHRVVRDGGRLLLSTPNRFSLGPDPHVGLWAAGYLPRRWIDSYARRQGALPPQRHLLSKTALEALLRDVGFERVEIFLPDFPAGQRAHFPAGMRLAIDGYHAAKRLPGARHLLEIVGPLFHAVCRKPDQTAPDSGRVVDDRRSVLDREVVDGLSPRGSGW